MIENEQSVLSFQKYSYKCALTFNLFFQNRSQQLCQSYVGTMGSAMSNLSGIPQFELVVDDIFKKCILGYLVQSRTIQSIDHYVISDEHAKGQKGLLDYLVFPLIARKITYDAVYYQNKKIESGFEYTIKFILYTPLVHILTLLNLLLEMLRMLSGILLTLICAVTVVPILHYQLQYSKNETKEVSSSLLQNDAINSSHHSNLLAR